MSEQYQNSGSIVGAKRVRKDEQDIKGRDKIVLTFGPDKKGRDGAKELAKAISELAEAGKQINFDIRIGEAEGAGGRTFPTAFVLIKEMIPKSEGGGQVGFAKTESRQDAMKAQAEKVRKSVEA